MKIRSLILAAFVLLALTVTLYWVEHRKPNDTKAPADAPPSILKLDANAITVIAIKKNAAEPIVLVKNSSGVWEITQPKACRADQSVISGVLSALATLNSERLVEEKATDLKQYGLDKPALEFDLTEKDNKSQALLIGDATPLGNAVYAMLAGDPRVFTLPSYLKGSIDKSLDDFRNKKLFDFGFAEPDKIELHNGSKTYLLSKGGTDWWSNGKKLDSASVQDLIAKLRDLVATRFFDSGFANPTIEITVTSDQGKTIGEVSIAKSGDGYIAKRQNESTLYELDASSVKAIQKAAGDIKPAVPPAK